MQTAKKIIIAAAIAATVFAFPHKAYSADEGSIEYYKDNMPVSERVVFGGELNIEQKAYILLSVLIYNKAENIPEGAYVKRVLFDRGELFVWLSDAAVSLGGEYENSLLREQITKTACSLTGVKSIIIVIDENFD